MTLRVLLGLVVSMTVPNHIYIYFNTTRRRTSGSVELSTPAHNFKWQSTFNESVMTGHCRKPQAHMSLSVHWPSWLICWSTVCFQVQAAGLEKRLLSLSRSVARLNNRNPLCILSEMCNQLIPYRLPVACRTVLVPHRVWNYEALFPDLELWPHTPSIFTDNI